MTMFPKHLRGSLNPRHLIDEIKYQRDFRAAHPDFFDPDGAIVFCGMQGTGKTLSAVQYIHKLVQAYPECMVVSNCKLTLPGYDKEIIPYTGYEQVSKLDNGYKGIILFLDEIQAEFSSLESKSIDPSWLQVISMQRKRRLHVVGTAQLFERIAKAWREQITIAVKCSCFLKKLQYNRLIDLSTVESHEDGSCVYKCVDYFFWWRRPAIYRMFDTWERIKKVRKK